MYERFIERLAYSDYNLNFILKDGYYLSMLFGIENRSTMDIDACLKDQTLSEKNLLYMVSEIARIDLNDDIIIDIDGISKIRTEDEYGEFRVDLTVKLDNMKESFHFDVATGDPITPSEVEFHYTTLFHQKIPKILVYNLETVLAEKVETILSRGERSSRMKDYYDIYLITNLKWNELNKDNLRSAFEKTFKKRSFNGDIEQIIKTIRYSSILKDSWNRYSKVNDFANDIAYDEVLQCLFKIVDEITPVFEV